MNTKIEGSAPGLPRLSTTAQAPRAADRERAPVGSSDSVKLSGEAASLASLERSLADAPAIDEAKVTNLRAALESGSYRIDPQEIANRLSDLERALGM